MIIDAHVHVFPPEIVRDRNKFARLDETFALMYLDPAAAPFLYKPALYRTFADLAGPDRLLYASDFPLLGLDRYRKHFANHEPDPDFEQKLFAENARAFWNL